MSELADLLRSGVDGLKIRESAPPRKVKEIELFDPYDDKLTYDDIKGHKIPSVMTTHVWIRYAHPMRLLYQLTINVGKWMLFYPVEQMDTMWAKAKNLYNGERLNGVLSILCSTAKKNPRASGLNSGVICFVCGPEDNRDHVLRLGEHLVKEMDYKSENGFIAFKSELQSITGTRSTGQVRNTLYQLPVPRPS